VTAALRQTAPTWERWRDELSAGRRALRESYYKQPKPQLLLRRHAQLIDRVVKSVWARAGLGSEAALVATGGYGRGELFPYSDVDLLVLLTEDPGPEQRESLERLIGAFWDIGLEIGHSVRTVQGCIEAARDDITVRTTLMESRYLAGSRGLYKNFKTSFNKETDPVSFLKAKKLEQEQRHAKHQDSPYSLEPNLKEAPGGLRDLQVIQWIARASGIGRRWSDLVKHGVIERDEARQLARHEAAMQDLRIRLHYLAGRASWAGCSPARRQLSTRAGPSGRQWPGCWWPGARSWLRRAACCVRSPGSPAHLTCARVAWRNCHAWPLVMRSSRAPSSWSAVPGVSIFPSMRWSAP
jgi:[protein-PII] uridylyltransferase